MIHSLKTNKRSFATHEKGKRSFEIRKGDRPYKIGDYLALNEWNGTEYTGRSILYKVVNVIDDSSMCKDDYVVLGIVPCKIKSIDVLTKRVVKVYE